ncbi:hypothetical protein SASPL_129580 [Salvia splendens]|uniref:X8 domain-containing protein n=1 Tax=Salvia splendens TaxID=180675 RepID=A0A8X8ZN37_SALSN|nr:hypothetical protein SASPL_129580 [Salvia splendens]
MEELSSNTPLPRAEQRPICGGHDPINRLGEIQGGPALRLRREANPSHQVIYTNIFEFMYDAFVWAFFKMKAPKDPAPPRGPIDTFVHALTDENKMPDFFMLHWGIYSSNGKPKSKIDLTGLGRDIYPSSAKGIMRMPERWCVFNGNRTDYLMVMKQHDYACKKTDCSSLKSGSSCNNISFNQNVSFTFNMYFQFRFQDEKAFRFNGLSIIIVENPSTPDNPKAKGYHISSNCVVSLFLLSLLGALFWN